MNLDINNIVNTLKENKFIEKFINELTQYIENSTKQKGESKLEINDNQKIISKYKDEILTKRNDILQNHAEQTKEKGEMYYIYSRASNENNSYNLYPCEKGREHEVITKTKEELPEGSEIGSVLRNKEGNITLDNETTEQVKNEIEEMIEEQIEKQTQYLESKRIEGHIYEAGEKVNGTIWLYDLQDIEKGEAEGIEEIEFPPDLYEKAKEEDRFIYTNGEYQKYDNA